MKKYRVFFFNFQCLEEEFSIYLIRHVFVMVHLNTTLFYLIVRSVPFCFVLFYSTLCCHSFGVACNRLPLHAHCMWLSL